MILVTGATGHIGNVLVRQLVNLGPRVRALVLRGEDISAIAEYEVDIVEGDVLDPQSLEIAHRNVDHVYHLASLITIMPGVNRAVQQVNVTGTKNMLNAAVQAGVKRFIYTSSIHAITRIPKGKVVDETLSYDPSNHYGEYDRSKAQASLMVEQAARDGLNAVIACPTGVIGPWDYRRSEVGEVIRTCVDGKLQFYIDGAYDFVDVRDVAQGIIQTGERGRIGQSYILSGEKITVLGLINTIKEITGRRLPRIKVPLRLAKYAAHFTPWYYRLTKQEARFTPYSIEVLQSNADISNLKAKSELDFTPRPLYDTLVDTVQWIFQQRDQDLIHR